MTKYVETAGTTYQTQKTTTAGCAGSQKQVTVEKIPAHSLSTFDILIDVFAITCLFIGSLIFFFI